MPCPERVEDRLGLSDGLVGEQGEVPGLRAPGPASTTGLAGMSSPSAVTGSPRWPTSTTVCSQHRDNETTLKHVTGRQNRLINEQGNRSPNNIHGRDLCTPDQHDGTIGLT